MYSLPRLFIVHIYLLNSPSFIYNSSNDAPFTFPLSTISPCPRHIPYLPICLYIYSGSQIRVESIMLRIARPLQFLCPALSPKQVASQPAMEAQPLNMEPEPYSFYTSPVVVLGKLHVTYSLLIPYPCSVIPRHSPSTNVITIST